MLNINNQKKAIVLFAFLTVGSAFLNAYGMVASVLEQVISFFSTLITYAVIVTLFSVFMGADVIDSKIRTYIGISFVLMTIVENVCPMILYSNQTLPDDYYFVFFIQLILNVYIAKVIAHERNS
ncbi:TPA: hypothetical protein ACVO0J_004685 [Vibrio diabolicus]|uniref:hypothetical protein n=1 Tax=Vibrio TaxID=662 RepID=UPI001F1F034A|nr:MULTISPECIES: hypothetical protein [Vibrio]MCF7479147.1 hypothetical protein [Vibrio sp. J2-4]MCR9304187.1 hypothetical protein [Vibrio diabolicus]MCR9426521.1 hypothetical protein [Vibrio diabolicus]MCR9478194.1 hypothetical protein [Vibrio antiquarius]MCS0207052.1 hypothetical protein [Vibrio sp. HS-50-1]